MKVNLQQNVSASHSEGIRVQPRLHSIGYSFGKFALRYPSFRQPFDFRLREFPGFDILSFWLMRLAQLAGHFEGVRLDDDDEAFRCAYFDKGDQLRGSRRIKFVLRHGPAETQGSFSTTQIEIALVSELILTLRIEPHDIDSVSPPALDLQIDDDLFDQRYAIEGAPTDVVKALLTPQTRRLLLAGDNATLRTSYGLYGGYLVYSEARSISDASEVATLVKRVADWVSDIAEITTRLANQRNLAMPASGDPFRTAPDTSGDEKMKLQRRREVLALDAARDRQDQLTTVLPLPLSRRALVGLTVAAVAVAAALAQLL